MHEIGTHVIDIQIYKIFVLPILNYAATVWSPHMQYYINKLEAIQKRAARFIVSNYRRLSSISHILNSLKLKSIVYHHSYKASSLDVLQDRQSPSRASYPQLYCTFYKMFTRKPG